MHDFIIVGAGSAGCVLAARLTEDLRNRVLLLEAGGTDKKQEIRIPAAFSKLFHSDLDWDYLTEPEPQTGNRARYWPRGKVLGGSSSMNAMMYVRGHPSDYDQWRQLGNAGWGFDELLPYFKKSEAFDGQGGVPAFHGTSGPLHVSSQRSPNPLAEAFIAAGRHLGLNRVDDINGPTHDGIGLTHVTQRDGRRWSAADAFLRPAMKRPNLNVETNCLVHKIIVVREKATGVVYERGGNIMVAQAAKEIILRTREGLAAPDIELIFAPAFFMEHGTVNPPGHGFTIGTILLRPESRGSITLRSSDVRIHPSIRANYLSTDTDIATLLAGVHYARRLAATPPFEPYRGDEIWPGSEKRTDEELTAFIREKVETLYHPVGTCKMGSDRMGVVDDQLRVRGVAGLRVADASIMPTIIGGHTHAAATMIGERVADFVRAGA